jgi:hypothetical protein
LQLDWGGAEGRNHFCNVETIRVLAVTISGIKEMLVLEDVPDL